MTGYRVERCQGAELRRPSPRIGTPTATTYKDTTVSASSSYSYRVRATDAAGNQGGYSPTASATTPAQTYSVGGSVSGLSGTVVLQNNGGNDLSVSANGSFAFSTQLASGAAYAVTVKSSPSGQTCAVSNGSGTVAGANVTTVAVACASAVVNVFDRRDRLRVVGHRRVAGQRQRQSERQPQRRVHVRHEAPHRRRVQRDRQDQPRRADLHRLRRHRCGRLSECHERRRHLQVEHVFDRWDRLRVVGHGRVAGQRWRQSERQRQRRVHVRDEASPGRRLQRDREDQPSGQSCSVSGGSGTVASANVTSVAVTCTTNTYSIGGSVSGLSGTVVLQDNGGDDLSVSGNGGFTFATKLPAGAAYNVAVKTSPSGQTCTVGGGSGTVGSANVTSVAVSCTNSTTTSASDDFNRVNGGLGASWVAMSDGGLSIASQQVVGAAGTHAGDIRAGESYGSDQYSQIEVTSTQLTGGQWIGPTVRSQNGGQDTYLGIYFWNNGTPQLRLYKRTAGTFTQLGSSYDSGPLPAGTKLTLSAQGSTIAFQQNGTTRISVTDTTLTGGAPGIMTYDTGSADNWTGGTGRPRRSPPIRSAGPCLGCRGRWCCRTMAVMISA